MSEAISNLYQKLFQQKWENKPIWEHISSSTFTSVPHLIGNQYEHEKRKIMIVGRSVNGWEVKFKDCSTLEATVNSVLYQKNRLDDFAKDFIEYTDNGIVKKYYYAKSPFLRMMKEIVEESTNSSDNWQQKIVWTNLFKVAPRKAGNPSWTFVRNDIPIYREILRHEINETNPDLVIFITGLSYIKPYDENSKYETFMPLFDNPNTNNLRENIELTGNFVDNKNTRMVVCKRPEFRCSKEIVKNIFDT